MDTENEAEMLAWIAGHWFEIATVSLLLLIAELLNIMIVTMNRTRASVDSILNQMVGDD